VRDLKPVDPSESTPVREDSGKRDRDHSDSQCSVGSMEAPVTRIDRVGSFMKSSISNMFRKGSLSMDEAPAEGAPASYFKLPTMRHDSIIKKEIMESTVAAFNTYEQLFDATETHHVLPVFAAGQAFVPSCFETLLVQSFYIVLTPIICEKLVSGQLSQTVVQVAIPPALLARKYVDVFRLFMSQRVLCLGLYRAPQKRFGALLPYVYLTPPVGQNFFYGAPIGHSVSHVVLVDCFRRGTLKCMRMTSCFVSAMLTTLIARSSVST
jgi:hypothetical protein